MSQSQGQSAPAATAGYGNQNGSAPPICANCQTSTTPLWRRDESGSVLCNACGLFLKLHGRPRPISLKTDVIKSRNRVKASQAKKRDSQGADATALPHLGNGYSAGHAEVAHLQHAAPPGHQHSLPMGSAMHEQQHARAASPNPIARSQTPVLHQQHTNIAPQHIFDTVSLPSDTFASPSIPHFPLRQPSPSQANAQSSNGHHTSQSSTQQQQQQQQHQDVLAQNETLRTRVSELEVINDLFRGRVSELEHNEQEYRQRENAREEEAQRLTAALAAALARAADLQRVVDEMQQQHLSNGGDKAGAEEEQTAEEGPARKKARIGSDSGADSISKVDSVQGAAQ
ncbi:uncharacterized protein SEPMUDRAFT_36665 [Sphaerulina musiva SO2202]|uniref:GATA-type domain-containing protein n=1 Tax=Sphaerulina musiva (strain SO2202) TaxID=692275 RepID=M3DAS0_SPHMS|nr:uncharacterized protein SEPMUDRAFT_36665 [Sphaerulina musiva SO2202]EMF14934.1 hypothetical protein SEPMUDRAFT_36665 [Sphaerulina musiva SO2202]